MSNFQIYFEIGFKHIDNWGALDHILFICALALRYTFSDWKKLLILVTAFTIGHCITLGLAVFDIIHVPSKWVELLIAITILITSFSNIFIKKFVYKTKFPPIYFYTLFFGLIHGLGFASEFVSLNGKSLQTAINLLYANVGIELAQLMFVCIALLISTFCINILKFNRREYILFVSGGIFSIALQMAIIRLP